MFYCRVLIITSFMIFLLGKANCDIIDILNLFFRLNGNKNNRRNRNRGDDSRGLSDFLTSLFDWNGVFTKLFSWNGRGHRSGGFDFYDFLSLFFGLNKKDNRDNRRYRSGGGGNGGLIRLFFAR
ncbi:unnamed protein product [Schistosoma rodhaini]|uniref:Uncharacterized protein n=1 Tax=Schistosoma rodhaini TaxID=6188 RepID=A0AA85G3X6_9TREM|nr:unnamed protein product [Schistosoma rodhaini]CAH8606508.1 unnamed protein product [Schistosoma rodhaini]